MSRPLMSIVIANWNGKALLKPCLESIFVQNHPTAILPQTRFEIIIVDNGSTDGSVAFIEKTHPELRLIKNPQNLGFAKANNQGILASKGEFILTLNNDTVLDKNFLAALMGAAADSEPHVGMWATKILSLSDKTIIDSVGGLLLYPDGLARGRGRLERDNSQYDALRKILLPSACAALYRKKMLDEVGLFDEDFFAYCEDTDLGLRARLLGWDAVNVPGAVCFHSYSATGGDYSTFKAYHVERNRAYVLIKNFPLSRILSSPFHTLRRYAKQLSSIRSGKGASSRIAKKTGKSGLFFIFIKVYFAVIINLPTLLKKRRIIQRRRTVAESEFSQWLLTDGISAEELTQKD
ncbi:Glycosyltransferase [hydrothermal vent metagenome]|uniref:Glycosyltransferase n=1 Tax=hydrothermal vent metagenome TaxID=652676 RepID=A0A3B0QZU1_9ZZZZ